ncbi:MAG: ATP-grasp domain-containing protein [Promethearchaeota archaeon]|nr:MAG: ATP-grasp domain-containing protein [Candidatus Lokiarchaeota archaeon]
MSKDIIFIFEFVSGGGFSQVNIPTSLFCEGFGMLRSIIADFKALDFEIHTILDFRIFFLSKFLQADDTKKVNLNENYITIFKNIAQKCKYTFIIAPESSNILFELTKISKNCNNIILSTNLRGIKLGSSKIKTYNFFKKNKVFTPRTYKIPYTNNKLLLDVDFIIQKYRELRCPIVIKPEDGVGAESIYYFENENHIVDFCSNSDRIIDTNRTFILQEYIKGRDLSSSLIGISNLDMNPIILSVNSQEIIIKNLKSEYFGGYTPLENYEEIKKKLSFVIKSMDLSKIEGYFGIDFIEKQTNSFHFIEINPRLTTSYIGVRNIINLNCAELILKSKLNILSTPEIKLLNHSYFTRLDFYCDEFENMEVFSEELMPKLMKLIPEFVTPPISLDGSNQYSCFIATKTKNLHSSKMRVRNIIQSLKSRNFKIIKPIQKELL